MGSTLTTYDALLKERYLDSSKVVEKLIYPDNVLLGMLEKRGDTGMVGDTLPVPIITGLPQGVGGVFATAQSNVSNIAASKWAITAGDYYGVVHIGHKVLAAARNNAGAFLDNKVAESDGVYEQAAEMLSIYAWRNGGGAIGRRATAATNDITLTKPEEAANFEVGMTVVASDNDGATSTDTLRTGSTTVTAVNPSTGVVTLASAAGITSFADNDYLFRSGDFNGDTGVVILRGVEAFITPNDSPGTLWGVTNTTRGNNLVRLSGCRVQSSLIAGKSHEERIKILLSQMQSRFKAKMPSAGFMNPEDFAVLDTLMSARGIRPLEDPNTKFGYMKIDVYCAGGRLPIYTDRHCPKGHFFALRLEDWWLSSMGELLRPQNEDGFSMLRRATSTDFEFRLISYPLEACRAPRNQGRCPLTD